MKDIVTEEEATSRVCPQRPGESVKGKDGVAELTYIDRMCIASKCMAWRLAHKPAASGEETGFCGAFGHPKFT